MKNAPIEPQYTARKIHAWGVENGIMITEGLAEDLAKKLGFPQLLEALENSFMAMGRVGANHIMDHQCRGAWENARTVIAKAKDFT